MLYQGAGHWLSGRSARLARECICNLRILRVIQYLECAGSIGGTWYPLPAECMHAYNYNISLTLFQSYLIICMSRHVHLADIIIPLASCTELRGRGKLWLCTEHTHQHQKEGHQCGHKHDACIWSKYCIDTGTLRPCKAPNTWLHKEHSLCGGS